GIARAIVMSPKYLLCDEPNSGLDPITSHVIDDLIKQITQELNITTIVNTHDMNSVITMGDKVIFIYKGEKHWEGSGKDILHADSQEVSEFLGTAKILNELRK
ncbi:MAG: ABC transporter ATP-binding protein, partial [Bacteroidia bacterium]